MIAGKPPASKVRIDGIAAEPTPSGTAPSCSGVKYSHSWYSFSPGWVQLYPNDALFDRSLAVISGMHSTSVCVRHASSVEAPTRAVRISTPSVQSILSISYASSSAVYAVGLSMWNEPSPSGHTSSMHVLNWGWPTGAPT